MIGLTGGISLQAGRHHHHHRPTFADLHVCSVFLEMLESYKGLWSVSPTGHWVFGPVETELQ